MEVRKINLKIKDKLWTNVFIKERLKVSEKVWMVVYRKTTSNLIDDIWNYIASQLRWDFYKQ